jgi:hypothetical protein
MTVNQSVAAYETLQCYTLAPGRASFMAAPRGPDRDKAGTVAELGLRFGPRS